MIPKKNPPYTSTKINPDKTMQDIKKLLQEYGSLGVQVTEMYQQNLVQIEFIMETEINNEKKQFTLKIVPPKMMRQVRAWDVKKGYVKQQVPNWSQSLRLVYYWLKSKLEAVSYGLVSIEKEFLAEMLTVKDGQPVTVGELIAEKAVTNQLALPTGQPTGEPTPTRTKENVIDAEVVE